MAMYEKEGYCPNNSFFLYPQKYHTCEYEAKAKIFQINMNLLRDRRGYMVYEDPCILIDDCTSILKICEVPLGTTLAEILRRLIPECDYAKIGKKIVLKDVTKIQQLDLSNKNAKILEDDNFILSVMDYKSKVEVKILKKVNQ